MKVIRNVSWVLIIVVLVGIFAIYLYHTSQVAKFKRSLKGRICYITSDAKLTFVELPNLQMKTLKNNDFANLSFLSFFNNQKGFIYSKTTMPYKTKVLYKCELTSQLEVNSIFGLPAFPGNISCPSLSYTDNEIAYRDDKGRLSIYDIKKESDRVIDLDIVGIFQPQWNEGGEILCVEQDIPYQEIGKPFLTLYKIVRVNVSDGDYEVLLEGYSPGWLSNDEIIYIKDGKKIMLYNMKTKKERYLFEDKILGPIKISFDNKAILYVRQTKPYSGQIIIRSIYNPNVYIRITNVGYGVKGLYWVNYND
ncbi:MAG: hypothetical protein PHP06_10980 [Clostridia bacterium]|nr:hypothetical protein [Clostridia bacterium]